MTNKEILNMAPNLYLDANNPSNIPLAGHQLSAIVDSAEKRGKKAIRRGITKKKLTKRKRL